MAIQNNWVPGSGYGNVYLDSLIWGCAWLYAGSQSSINYSFASGSVPVSESDVGMFVGTPWLDVEKNAFRTALSNYSSVCNLKFAEITANTLSADMVWWKTPASLLGEQILGMHDVPDGGGAKVYGYFNDQDSSWKNLDQGSYGYVSIIHELGHGVGLAHPHDGGNEPDATTFPGVYNDSKSLGRDGLNQGIWTTMSYNDGWSDHYSDTQAYGWQGSLMAFDIAALQKLYGANTNTATGDNVYQLPVANQAGTYWSCIWDAGGTDTISCNGHYLI